MTATPANRRRIALMGVAALCVALLTAVFVIRSRAGIEPEVVAGGDLLEGSALDLLRQPMGVVVDRDGDVFVSDYGNDRVVRWSPRSRRGTVVAGGYGPGSAANELSGAHGVAVDRSGALYIADTYNDRVVRWDVAAPRRWNSPFAWSTKGEVVAGGNGQGLAPNQLNRPTDVAIDKEGNLVIVNQGNLLLPGDRVVRWRPGATEGTVIAGAHGVGPDASQLSAPTSVALDESGNLYISDYNNHRVVRWAPGASVGTVVAGGIGPDRSLIGLKHPHGIALDRDGNLYVADTDNHRVVRWEPGALEGEIVAGGKRRGWKPDRLVTPFDVALDRGGALYVVDFDLSRVVKWHIAR